ncbi:hypothetical protein OMP38_14515 [Cohnella ginsengisoli]|uniref:Uncharacterized protein n=1 Tax=Cohnella ginsengisoli TaxID=425004 RepID=A0A9X4QNU4_9BACL|nr:hypothetical protein [Cohnella ginsengisoli]MDG0791930.1 hypothetical protein [Cohnella ginsengisoli]
MKATINGVTVEGTPQEINEYMRLREEKNTQNTDWIKKQLEGAITGRKCPNAPYPCNCSGACNGVGTYAYVMNNQSKWPGLQG